MRFLTFTLIWIMTAIPGQHTPTYKLALPGYHFVFPRDHASHPEYKLEWWYFTGQVRDNNGGEFGYELTFFRTGLDRTYDNPSKWTVQQLHMAHFALSDLSKRQFYFFEKLNREGPGIAGARTDTLKCWNENWSVELDGNVIRLSAVADRSRIHLDLVPEKPPVVHGHDGVSQKAEGLGHASHYYSLTRLRTTGTLTSGAETHNVQGESWMDHEFGTNQLTEQQVGWDWFSVQFDNGVELMLYRMRLRNGGIDPHSSGSIVQADSRKTHLDSSSFQATPQKIWKSPKTGSSYPIEWQIEIPGDNAALRVIAEMDDQELVTTRSTGIAYWEGAVRIEGVWKGKAVRGKGYLELTGYAERFRPRV